MSLVRKNKKRLLNERNKQIYDVDKSLSTRKQKIDVLNANGYRIHVKSSTEKVDKAMEKVVSEIAMQQEAENARQNAANRRKRLRQSRR
jgi:septal ring factor EnvC (AmiA/AmiB activator)